MSRRQSCPSLHIGLFGLRIIVRMAIRQRSPYHLPGRLWLLCVYASSPVHRSVSWLNLWCSWNFVPAGECSFQGIHGSEFWKQTSWPRQMHDIAEAPTSAVTWTLAVSEIRPISRCTLPPASRCSAVSLLIEQSLSPRPCPLHPRSLGHCPCNRIGCHDAILLRNPNFQD